MTYTGGWLRGAYVDPAAAKVPIANPAHGQDQGDAYAYAHQSPPLTEVGPVGEYPGSEWVVTTMGTVLDHTDYQSHDASTADQGAARQGYYGVPATQFADERYTGHHFPGLPGQPMNPVAVQRGFNSQSQNNPNGFEPGQQQVNDFWVDRKFAVGQRVHDRRIVTPNTAYRDVNKPAAQHGNSLTSAFVFDSLAKSISRVNMRPQMRRQPEPVTADLDTDQTGPSAPVISSWVVG